MDNPELLEHRDLLDSLVLQALREIPGKLEPQEPRAQQVPRDRPEPLALQAALVLQGLQGQMVPLVPQDLKASLVLTEYPVEMVLQDLLGPLVVLVLTVNQDLTETLVTLVLRVLQALRERREPLGCLVRRVLKVTRVSKGRWVSQETQGLPGLQDK